QRSRCCGRSRSQSSWVRIGGCGYRGYLGYGPGQGSNRGIRGNRLIGYRVGFGNRLSCRVTWVTGVTDLWQWCGEIASPGVGEAVLATGLVALHGFAMEFEQARFDAEAVEEPGESAGVEGFAIEVSPGCFVEVTEGGEDVGGAHSVR